MIEMKLALNQPARHVANNTKGVALFEDCGNNSIIRNHKANNIKGIYLYLDLYPENSILENDITNNSNGVNLEFAWVT
jgi:hypothetical protein